MMNMLFVCLCVCVCVCDCALMFLQLTVWHGSWIQRCLYRRNFKPKWLVCACMHIHAH